MALLGTTPQVLYAVTEKLLPTGTDVCTFASVTWGQASVWSTRAILSVLSRAFGGVTTTVPLWDIVMLVDHVKNIELWKTACRQGRLDLVQWMHASNSFTAVDAAVGQVLIHACRGGHLDVAQWLHSTFSMDVTAFVVSRKCAMMAWLRQQGFVNLPNFFDAMPDNTQGTPQEHIQNIMLTLCLGSPKDLDDNSVLRMCQWLHATFDCMPHLLQHTKPRQYNASSRKLGKPRFDHMDGALEAACHSGFLATAQWLVQLFVAHYGRPPMVDVALYGACDKGHLAVAQWLITVGGLGADQLSTGLDSACIKGHLALAQWIYKETNAVFGLDNDKYLVRLCERGHLDVIRWFIDLLCFHDIVAVRTSALPSAYVNGHQHVVQWLVARFEITNAQLQPSLCNSIPRVCLVGHSNHARWLIETFDLAPMLRSGDLISPILLVSAPYRFSRSTLKCTLQTLDFFHNIFNFSQSELNTAAEWCYLHFDFCRVPLAILQWLHAKGVSVDRTMVVSAFKVALEYGTLDVASWLAEQYQLTKDELGVHSLCASPSLEFVQWAVAHFGITKEEARQQSCFGFRYACHHGHYRVACWLVRHFQITAAEAVGLDLYALKFVINEGYLGLAQWLISRYGVSALDKTPNAEYSDVDTEFIN